MARPTTPAGKLQHDLLALLIFGVLLSFWFGIGTQGCRDNACVIRVLGTPWLFIIAIAAVRAAFYWRGLNRKS